MTKNAVVYLNYLCVSDGFLPRGQQGKDPADVLAEFNVFLPSVVKDTGVRGLIRFVRDTMASPWLDYTWLNDRLTLP